MHFDTAPARSLEPGHARGAAWLPVDVLVAASLLALSALLAVFYYIGPLGSDDLQYVQLLAGGRPQAGTARYAVSGLYALLGARASLQMAAYGFFLYAFAMSLLTYVAARRFMHRRIAASAAILVACNPLIFYYSAAILPDNALAFFCLLHVAGFASYAWSGRRAIHASVSGAALAACYATKEASLVFALPTLVAGLSLLLREGRAVWSGIVSFTMGLVVVLGMDMLASAVLFDDPIYRLTFVLENDIQGDAEAIMRLQGTAPMARAKYIVERMLAYWPGPLLALHMIALLLLPAFAWRWKPALSGPAWYLAASGLVVIGYLTWGSVSLDHYIGVPLQVRYYAPAVPLLAIAAAVLAWAVPVRVPLVANGAVVAVALLAACAWQVQRPAPHAGNAYRARDVIAIGRAIALSKAAFPDVPVVGDSYVSGRYLPYRQSMGALPWARRHELEGRPFVFISTSRATADRDQLAGCAGRIHPVAPSGLFRLPRNRNSELGLMLGAVSNVRFEPGERAAAFVVEEMRPGCDK